MKLRSALTLSLFSLTALAAARGCDGDGPAQVDPSLGSVQLSLATVPADAACLRVTAAGSRAMTRLYPLTPGTQPTFMLDRLPVGIVTIDGQVFNVVCASVASATVPTFVADAPIPVRVDPVSVAQVNLKLISNGRVSVSVDFESPAWISTARQPLDIALFGDTPYGSTQIADFPRFIADINAATPPVAELVHLGDIKNGSSRCDTTYFQFVLDNLNLSGKPLLYTPGDNEWTDCHRANNGAYDPLERLAVIRSMFFPVPGLSLGVSKRQVLSQSFFPSSETFVENQLWFEAGTLFTMIHVVGSNNSLLPWYTDDTTGTKVDDPVRRNAEEAARAQAGLDWLDRSFTEAVAQNAAGVVILMQADMWDGSASNGFDSTIQKIAARTLAFAKPVLLVEGDSHIFKVDNPLAAGDAVHGVTTPVPNITRMVVQGSTTAPLSEWVRLHVDPAAAQPFSWTRNPR